MEIASRESNLLTTNKYFDECSKTIRIRKFYVGDTKIPVFRLKTVEFRNPDGTIDKDRADSSRLLIDKSNETYTYRDLKPKSFVDRGRFTETTKIWKEYGGYNNDILYINKKRVLRFNEYGEISKNIYTFRERALNEKNEPKTLYDRREVNLVKHINVNGCTETINIWKEYTIRTRTPHRRHKTVEFRNCDNTIDKKRSSKCKQVRDKGGESDFEDESPDVL